MPARAWLIHFPDEETTVVAPRQELPQAGDELLAGWVVVDHTDPSRPSEDLIDFWVEPKASRRTVRQRTDRR